MTQTQLNISCFKSPKILLLWFGILGFTTVFSQDGGPVEVRDNQGKIKYIEYVDSDIEFGRAPGYSKFRVHYQYDGELLQRTWYMSFS